MEIKLNIQQPDIFRFLQKRGYEIEPVSYVLPAVEEFLINEPERIVYTFIATKPGEKRSRENVYLKVFEKELREFLKENNEEK